MFLRGDFHMHSTASDGKLSPELLIAEAAKGNVDIIALTDHDTIDGIDSAIAEGENLNIKVIPGVELSTRHNGESIHILGYFKDDSYKNPELKDFLNSLKNFRSIRAKKIIENLNTHFNIDLDYEAIYKKAKGVIARPHIAQAIIDTGYTDDWQYVFDNLLGDDSPAYVPTKKVSVPEGIELLRSYNAFIVLAHPVLIKNTSMDEMLKFGFDGIEAIYPLNSSEDDAKFRELAKAQGKVITAGSDFHGIANDDKHGKIGSFPLMGEDLQTFLSNFNI